MGVKNKVVHFDISEKVYDSDCHVFIGKGKFVIEAMNKHLRKYHPKHNEFDKSDISDCSGSCIQFNGARLTYLWLPRIPKTPEEHGTLAHECCHIAFHYFDHIESQVYKGHDEPFNYFVKFLVKTFWEKVKR